MKRTAGPLASTKPAKATKAARPAPKGPDPSTPSLDQLVDNPRQFLVGFHTDGATFVADAFGTKSRVRSGRHGAWHGGISRSCPAAAAALSAAAAARQPPLPVYRLAVCKPVCQSLPQHLLTISCYPPRLALPQQYPRLRWTLGQTNPSLLLACQQYIGNQQIASVHAHGGRNSGAPQWP